MNKNTQNKNRKMSKLSSYLKVSCSALILSSSLVGYGFTKDAFAATQDAETATSETSTHVQKDLQDAINKAKEDIKQLKHLSAVELKSYKEDIESAKNQTEIKNIIKEAKKENKATAQENTTDVSNKDNSTESSSTQDASTEEKATTSHDTSADDTSNISNDLDNIVSDLDALSNKVDSGQQKDATTSNESSSSESNTSENTTDEVTKEESTTEESSKEAPTTEDPSNQPTSSKSETSIVDKLDSIKNDIDSAKKDMESSKENNSNQLPSDDNNTEEATTESSSTQEAPTTEDTTHSNSNHHLLDELAKLNNTHKDQDLDTDVRHHQFDKVNHQLSETEKINQAIAKIENSKDDASHLYINRKLDQLSDLRDKIQNQADLAKKDKQAIDNDIETVRKNIENNRDIILNRLQQASDKQHAAEDILNSVFSKNEAQHILKNIKTKGQSDKQIADQIMKQIDGLTSTTSDDILKSMLEQATNKEDLLKTILSTRLGQNEAATIAKRLANDHLTNSQIVDRLKQAFNQHGLVSSDDILNDILNDILDKTSNRKQAIETMLATKLNQAKAKVLADIISRVQSDKANALDLVKSTINGKANDLLQLQNSLGQAKNRLNYILDPIVNRPSLLDRITGNTSGSNLGSSLLGNLPSGSSLLDGLTNGNSLLDGISDIPDPTQGLSLGHLGDDGLLSGLFNSDGNLSLPATGEAIKKNWIPIAAVIAIAGGALVWFSRRKHHQSNN